MLLFSTNTYSDKEIVEGLQTNSPFENNILKFLYTTYYTPVKKIILSKGGNDIEAQDIFQMTIIVFYMNVKARKFELKAKISTYLISVARNMWINRKKEMIRLVTLDNLADKNGENHLGLELLLEKERNEFANELLKALSVDCRRILTLSIYQKLSMKKISQLMGYQNEQVARNKKSKCLRYLKKIVDKSGHLTSRLEELR